MCCTAVQLRLTVQRKKCEKYESDDVTLDIRHSKEQPPDQPTVATSPVQVQNEPPTEVIANLAEEVAGLKLQTKSFITHMQLMRHELQKEI